MSSTRMAIAVLTLLFVLPAAALAADNADSAILGFSPDGRYFAFEEYGVQDGSGFPFSSIYLIDTASDRWVGGTPVRVLNEDESATLSATRSEAREAAEPLLATRQIGVQGATVVSNPLTETSADPYFVSFRTMSLSVPTSEPAFQLALETYELPAPNCPDMELGMPFQGFRLSLTDTNGAVRILSQDSKIPKNRRCPLNYGISEVVIFFPPGELPVIVVMVNVFSFGFEGLDRYFVAVTGRLD